MGVRRATDDGSDRPASRTASPGGRVTRTTARVLILLLVAAVQFGTWAITASADGGDFQLDFASATPGTYDQTTGTGGTWSDVVQQLEGGAFTCGDVVQHLTEIVVDAGATGTQAIDITYSFDTQTTAGDPVGYGDVTYASINAGDPANQLSGNETVTKTSEHTVGDEIIATVAVTGLDAGEVLILSMGAQLACQVGTGKVSGNIHATLESAETSEGDAINSGNDDTPLVGAGQIAEPGIDVTKSCAPSDVAVGDDVTYTITVSNTGNEGLEGITVSDSILGSLNGSFADTLAAGDSESHDFTYTVNQSDPDPLINEVTVNATGSVSGSAVSDSATCSTNVVHEPSILVEKSCTPSVVAIGGTVTYTVTVTNNGTDDLEGVTVDDTVLGDLSSSYADTLAAGASESHDFDHVVTATDPDPLVNTVTAEADGLDSGTHVSDTDSCSSDISHQASILVEKSCAPSSVPIGGTVTYTITVSNTGDDVLEGITVQDSVLGDLSGSFADTLDPGASESHDFDHVVTAGDDDPLVNTVTAEADGADSGTHVSSTAECSTDVSHTASIDVEKSCAPSSVPIGGTVTYTITVTNTGDDVLEGITVDDSALGRLNDSFADTLNPGESESHDFDHVVTADDPDPLENVVDVAATGADSGAAATASASCSTDVSHAPGIAVAKTCDASAGVGDTITYDITVTNTGDEPLTDLTVSDSILGDLSGAFADTLAVGASETETFTHTVTASDPDPLENEVTVTGVGEDSQVTASAGVVCSTAIPAPPPPPSGGGSPATPPIALTGVDAARGLAAILMLLVGGALLVFLGRERRRGAEPGSAE